MKKMNSKGAMEMSVGTIVTIVLLMSVLVLGLYFVQKIFASGSNAIDSVDSQVQSEINRLFSNGETKLAVYPTSREITLKKGDTPKGFAFSVYNNDVSEADFEYTLKASDVTNCGNTMTKQIAESYILGKTASFPLGPGSSLDNARLVRFDLPESAPPCTIIYTLDVKRNGAEYSNADIFVTIK
ncbi:hypothetical protein J4411_03730 [Candidatus Pacearchaeota archaeon]|nr:hypothetical protein [Candidatus Pacearchaeota archaeon]